MTIETTMQGMDLAKPGVAPKPVLHGFEEMRKLIEDLAGKVCVGRVCEKLHQSLARMMELEVELLRARANAKLADDRAARTLSQASTIAGERDALRRQLEQATQALVPYRVAHDQHGKDQATLREILRVPDGVTIAQHARVVRELADRALVAVAPTKGRRASRPRKGGARS